MSALKVTGLARRGHDVLIIFGSRHLEFTPRIDLDRLPLKWYRPLRDEYQEKVSGLSCLKLFADDKLVVHLKLHPVEVIEKIDAKFRPRHLSQYWDAVVLHTQTVRGVFPDDYINQVVNQERDARSRLNRGSIRLAPGAQQPAPAHRLGRIFPTRIGGL